MDANAVRLQITDAWKHIPYTKAVDRILSRESVSPEVNELHRDLRGMAWQDVPAEMLHRGAANLILLDWRARPYYLPAMMLAAMSFDLASASVVDSLSTARRGQSAETLQELVDALNATQRQAVVVFLRFMVDLFDQELEAKYAARCRRRVNGAISRYWAPRESGDAAS